MAIIDIERARNLYNSESYESNTNDWEDSTSAFRARAFHEALAQAGLAQRAGSFLDVGCGSGGVLMKLSANHGSQIKGGQGRFEGIDLSPNAVKIAQQLYPDAEAHGVSFAVGLVQDKVVAEPYDVVSLIHVLEHCPDMLEMLAACERVGRHLYINVPIEVNLMYTLRRRVLVHQYLSYGHLHFFNEEFFLCWLEKNGFEILSTVYSADFEIPKAGLGYRVTQALRRWTGRVLGPSVATWLLGGYSFGVLVRSRALPARAA
ncbi:conserved hypothetical protein [Rubrivivax sp. A210]|uniref:class I SAM-dependent methyltransferase n=1 Tax=Rubrivivax sp. A210 TaxID=2772301 RepID=UPI0019196A91|nr:class I SAM-dependent methyltransferase [Rubrivivax sp. A210]CAD5370709.1 conserved hypothetical protein [Rubrivivax sp. A210]